MRSEHRLFHRSGARHCLPPRARVVRHPRKADAKIVAISNSRSSPEFRWSISFVRLSQSVPRVGSDEQTRETFRQQKRQQKAAKFVRPRRNEIYVCLRTPHIVRSYARNRDYIQIHCGDLFGTWEDILVASMATNRSMAPTICSAAIRQWEKDQKQKASKAQEVNLCFQWPPIEKMDNALAELVSCEKLVLSVNRIDKIAGIATLKNLTFLSLTRNSIKSLAGIEVLGDTLQVLWISYNFIEKMKGIEAMKKLRVLHMSNNLVREWKEFERLREVNELRELLFVGNPLYETQTSVTDWRYMVGLQLPLLERLDSETLIRMSEEDKKNANIWKQFLKSFHFSFLVLDEAQSMPLDSSLDLHVPRHEQFEDTRQLRHSYPDLLSCMKEENSLLYIHNSFFRKNIFNIMYESPNKSFVGVKINSNLCERPKKVTKPSCLKVSSCSRLKFTSSGDKNIYTISGIRKTVSEDIIPDIT